MKPEYSVEAGKKKLKLNNTKKPLSNKGREPNKFNSDMAPLKGFKPRLNWWEVMPLPVRNIFFSFKLHCDYSSLLKLIKWGGFFENRIQVQREQKKIRSLPMSYRKHRMIWRCRCVRYRLFSDKLFKFSCSFMLLISNACARITFSALNWA